MFYAYIVYQISVLSDKTRLICIYCHPLAHEKWVIPQSMHAAIYVYLCKAADIWKF